MSAAELSPELRKLIDARLEAIDRVLVQGQVAWSERRNIVDEVETQIFELLGRRTLMPAPADVQAILDSLDPPESYLPEHLRERVAAAPAPGLSLPGQVARFSRQFASTLLGVGGFAAANLIVIAILIASDGVIPWLVTLAGLAWLNCLVLRWIRTWTVDDLRHGIAAWLLKNGAPAT